MLINTWTTSIADVGVQGKADYPRVTRFHAVSCPTQGFVHNSPYKSLSLRMKSYSKGFVLLRRGWRAPCKHTVLFCWPTMKGLVHMVTIGFCNYVVLFLIFSSLLQAICCSTSLELLTQTFFVRLHTSKHYCCCRFEWHLAVSRTLAGTATCHVRLLQAFILSSVIQFETVWTSDEYGLLTKNIQNTSCIISVTG